MSRVIIRGWRPGMNKVELNRLLRDRAEMSLKESKASVDLILEGKEVSIDIPDRETAKALAEAMDGLGAICRIDEAAVVR